MKSLAVFYYEAGNFEMMYAVEGAAKAVEKNFPNTLVIRIPVPQGQSCHMQVVSPDTFVKWPTIS